jgi:hypothetical protein
LGTLDGTIGALVVVVVGLVAWVVVLCAVLDVVVAAALVVVVVAFAAVVVVEVDAATLVVVVDADAFFLGAEEHPASAHSESAVHAARANALPLTIASVPSPSSGSTSG